MREWLRGKPAALAVLLLVAVLVVGGLGWATAAALRLENEQRAERAEADRNNRLRLALWRLDGYMAPLVVREDSRSFNHYSSLYASPLAFNSGGHPWDAGAVMEPSPLLGADTRPWMLLHFQAAADTGWESPQAPPPALLELLLGLPARELLHTVLDAQATPHERFLAGLELLLGSQPPRTPLDNVTPERARLLAELRTALPAERLVARTEEQVGPATQRDTTLLALRLRRQQDNWANQGQGGFNPLPNQPPGQQAAFNTSNPPNGSQQDQQKREYELRQNYTNDLLNDDKNPQRLARDVANLNTVRNGLDWFTLDGNTRRKVQGVEADVRLSPMTAVWIDGADGQERLLLVRLVRIEQREVCQGVLLDAAALEEELAGQVQDLLPGARLVPVREADAPSRSGA